MPKKIEFSEKEKRDIIKRYVEKKKSMEFIARSYRVSYRVIRRILIENNIKIRKTKYRWDKKQIQNIIKKYIKEKKSSTSIAGDYNVSYYMIKEVLTENNIKMRGRDPYRIYDVDHNYFENIDTPEKAYWLGFLTADGNVIKGDTGGYSVRMELSIHDSEHLKKFKKALSSEHLIKKHTNSNMMGIAIYSKKMFNDLVKHGVISNKTKIIRPIKLDNDLVHHYWRGIFDGDGCIGVHRKDPYKRGWRESWVIQLTGNKYILNGFKEYANSVCGTFATVRARQGGYIIGIVGNNIVPKLANSLYKNVNISTCLQRKYNIYRKMVEDIRSNKE